MRAKIFLAGSWYQSHVPSASNPFAFRSLPHASPDSKGYDDLWDKCDKWRRIPNATEADAPFACSMRVPLSTLGFWALHAGLPFCCLAPLFVLWLAIYARKLYAPDCMPASMQPGHTPLRVERMVAGELPANSTVGRRCHICARTVWHSTRNARQLHLRTSHLLSNP